MFTINEGQSFVHFPVATTKPVFSAYNVPSAVGQWLRSPEEGQVLQVQKVSSEQRKYQQVHTWELVEFLPAALLDGVTVFRELSDVGHVVLEKKDTGVAVAEVKDGQVVRRDGRMFVPYEKVLETDKLQGIVMQLAHFAGGLSRCLYFSEPGGGRIDRVELPSFKLTFTLVKDLLTNEPVLHFKTVATCAWWTPCRKGSVPCSPRWNSSSWFKTARR